VLFKSEGLEAERIGKRKEEVLEGWGETEWPHYGTPVRRPAFPSHRQPGPGKPPLAPAAEKLPVSLPHGSESEAEFMRFA